MVLKNKHIIDSCKIIENTLKKKLDQNSRIAIVGIGNEFRYDDVAGFQVLKNLIKRSKIKNPTKEILLVEGETAPHAKIIEIQDWKPTHLIMLDAADLRKPPGTVEFIEKYEMQKFSTTSHSGSKQILLDFLTASIKNLEIIIIGIQVEKIIFEKGISDNVAIAIEKLTKVFEKLLF
ncbi:MAG: hydrogenase maturation protease [Candidatus Helarchaeota archaeon]